MATSSLAPATPRRHVPNARRLAAINSSLKAAIGRCCGQAFETFALAQIDILQADANFREEEPMFTNTGEQAPDNKLWQTFDNYISDEPNKVVKKPVTIMADVKMGLAALLVGIADLVNEAGTDLGSLAGARWREANIVRLMLAATASSSHVLRADPLCRELNYPQALRQKFEALVTVKSLVDPGGAILNLFLGFIKVIAWYAAVFAYEQGHYTLNRVNLFGIIALMEAGFPEKEAPVVRDVLSLMRERWSAAIQAGPSRAKKQVKVTAKPSESGAEPPEPAAEPLKQAAKQAAMPSEQAEPVTKEAAKKPKKPKQAAKPPEQAAKQLEQTAKQLEPAAEQLEPAAEQFEPAAKHLKQVAKQVAKQPEHAKKAPSLEAALSGANVDLSHSLNYDILLAEINSGGAL